MRPEQIITLRCLRDDLPLPVPFAHPPTWAGMVIEGGCVITNAGLDYLAQVEKVERLTAERAELLGPVGDFDLKWILKPGDPCCHCGTPLSAHDNENHGFAENAPVEDILALEIVRLRAERAGMIAERDAIIQALDDDCAPDIDGQQVKTLADRVNALLGRWQDEIRGALCASVPAPHCIDGGGCDSGDPLDLTLAEVAQALNQLTDQADEQIAALTAERDAARRDAERTYAGWVCGASMDHGTVTVKIDGDPEAVAGVHLGEKARAMVHLFAYPRTSRR